jgi:phosphoserine phosphatase RsbX
MVTVERCHGLIDWAVASRPLHEGARTGDAAVCETDGRRALIAAIDGLGHGNEAATAAEAAAAVLRQYADEELTALVLRCHDALAETRGAAMSLARFDGGERTVTWLGVGNVEGRLVRRDRAGLAKSTSLLLPGGAVGHQLPPLVPTTLDVQLGDAVILATDGIENDFAETADLAGPATEISNRILSAKAKETDDALVVVARYVERGRDG